MNKKIDVTGNYFAIKAAAVAAGILKEGELPKKAALLEMVAAYNAQQAEVQTKAQKIWRATGEKPVKTKLQKELVALLSEGATLQQICEKFGWKDWTPSKSCVRKLGYSIYQRDGIFFVAQ